jgi:hypothetical protein
MYIRHKSIFSSERMLRKTYDRKGSIEEMSGRESKGAWQEDELFCSKSLVVK